MPSMTMERPVGQKENEVTATDWDVDELIQNEQGNESSSVDVASDDTEKETSQEVDRQQQEEKAIANVAIDAADGSYDGLPSVGVDDEALMPLVLNSAGGVSRLNEIIPSAKGKGDGDSGVAPTTPFRRFDPVALHAESVAHALNTKETQSDKPQSRGVIPKPDFVGVAESSPASTETQPDKPTPFRGFGDVAKERARKEIERQQQPEQKTANKSETEVRYTRARGLVGRFKDGIMGLPDNAKDTLRKGRGFVGGLFSGFNRGRHQRRTPDAYDRKLSAMAEASDLAHKGEGPVENYMFIDPEAAAIRRERMRERGGSESVSTTPERPNAQPPQIDARSESPNNANAAAGLERRAGYDKETGGESLKARALAAVGRFGRFLKNKYNQMTSRMNGYMSNRQQQRELSRLSREYGGSLGADLAYAADNLGRSATTSPERPDAQPSRANTQPEVNTPNQPQQAEQSNQSAESAPVTYPEMAASDNDDGGNLNDNQERNHDEEGKNETRGETLDEKEMMKQTWDSAKLLTQMINDWRLRQGNSLGRAVSSDEFNDQLGAAATLFDAPVDGPISLNGDGFVAFSEYMKQLPTNQEPSLEDFVKHYNK